MWEIRADNGEERESSISEFASAFKVNVVPRVLG
jgi:hypothetical protein